MKIYKLFYKTKIRLSLWIISLVVSFSIIIPVFIYFVTSIPDINEAPLLLPILLGFVISLFVAFIFVIILEKFLLNPIDELGFQALTLASQQSINKIDVGADPNLTFIAFAFNHLQKQLDFEKVSASQFISDVSHEFKTPLTSIINAIDLLELEKSNLSDNGKKIFDMLSTDIQYFENLVLELLSLAKLENEAVSQHIEKINLKDWLGININKIIELIQNSMPDEKLETPKIVVDDEQIFVSTFLFERIITNIINNAYIHGKGCEKIIVSKKLDEVWIEIFDNGSGIDEGDEEKIFERFYRGKAIGNRGKVKGTGLGLSIVASFVKLLDGRIWAYNRLDKQGACFVVSFPSEAKI